MPHRPQTGRRLPVPDPATMLTGRRMTRTVIGSAMMIALLVLLAYARPTAHVAAVLGGDISTTSAAQVRIFGDGEFLASGTLVGRNWVLTARHAVRHNLAYTIRFGVTNDNADSPSNLRTIDRIEPHPQADLALIHFAEPVSPYTWIPRLTTGPPPRNSDARQYGWGPEGTALRRLLVPVLDPVAAKNAAHLRDFDPVFRAAFPEGVEPLVLDLVNNEGDSGAGAFDTAGNLIGVISLLSTYQNVNGTGRLDGFDFLATYDQPVWPEADWIRRIINGEGSSSSPPASQSSSPPASQSTRRQLAEQPAGGLPLTQPPQDHVCDPDDQACHQPKPIWLSGTITGGGNYRGTALARCAAAGNNSCSFSNTNYSAGAQARLLLGPTSATEAPGVRKILAWCATQTAFPTADSPSRHVLRVSFTNDDPDDTPTGYGWWDLTPDQVNDPTTNRPIDPSRLNAC
jgi:hypothetical protein